MGNFSNNYVYLSSVQMRNELCGGVIKGALPEGSVALFPQKCSAGYLSFLLNSLPCKLALFGNKLNVKAKTKISRKAVGELIVFEVEKDSDEAYAIADQLRTLAFEQYNKDRSNAAFHHFYMIWDDFCNILAIELYAHPLFEKNDIHILENWKDVLLRFSKDNDLNVLFGFLTKSDEKLRNEINPNPTPRLDQYRKRILNPASHNDSKAKVFRSELILAIEEISQFEKIKKLTMTVPEDISNREFVMEIDHNGHHVVVEFKILESWSKLEYNGHTYYEAVNVQHTSHVGIGLKNKEMTILSIFNRVCNFVGYTPGTYPDMDTVIRDKASGTLLKNLPAI